MQTASAASAASLRSVTLLVPSARDFDTGELVHFTASDIDAMLRLVRVTCPDADVYVMAADEGDARTALGMYVGGPPPRTYGGTTQDWALHLPRAEAVGERRSNVSALFADVAKLPAL